MILTHSNGWAHLRSSTFLTIPPETVSFYRAGLTTAEWRQNGSYLITAMTPSSVEINADRSELSQALLGDSEYLLDHAHEQLAMLKSAVASEWTSPAWFLVTAYYMAFFSVMALLRMLGNTPIWFDADDLERFELLYGSSVPTKKTGTYGFEVTPAADATRSTVTCKSKRQKPHEAAWNTFSMKVIEANKKTTKRANDIESRYLEVLARAFNVLGADWPSALRNEVNYHPGAAYREVVRDASLDLVRFCRQLDLESESEFVDKLESSWAAVDADRSTRNRSNLLLLCSALIVALSSDMHLELIEAGMDRRWRNLRSRFLRERSLRQDLLRWYSPPDA